MKEDLENKKPPIWFYIIIIALFIFGLVKCVGFYNDEYDAMWSDSPEDKAVRDYQYDQYNKSKTNVYEHLREQRQQNSGQNSDSE